ANPHCWAGSAFYDTARAEKNPEARLGWLSRSEEEFRRAVEAAPDDWDTKFDYELTGRLAAELRKQPKNPPNQLMQLLRPQPKIGPKPPTRVGGSRALCHGDEVPPSRHGVVVSRRAA